MPPLFDTLVEHMPPVESIKIEDFKTGRFNHETPRAITFSEAASVFGKEFVKQELANFMSDLKAAKVTRSEVQLTIDGKQEVAETLLKDVLPLSLKWTLPEPDQVDHHKLVRDVLVPSVFGIRRALSRSARRGFSSRACERRTPARASVSCHDADA